LVPVERKLLVCCRGLEARGAQKMIIYQEVIFRIAAGERLHPVAGSAMSASADDRHSQRQAPRGDASSAPRRICTAQNSAAAISMTNGTECALVNDWACSCEGAPGELTYRTMMTSRLREGAALNRCIVRSADGSSLNLRNVKLGVRTRV
jgi:hypothetical protein